jgi:hypothetical protein
MKANKKERYAFRDCFAALGKLEEAFRLAGENIEFRLNLRGGKDPYVEIIRNGTINALKFIEGDSPAQAVRNVAAAARLQEDV